MFSLINARFNMKTQETLIVLVQVLLLVGQFFEFLSQLVLGLSSINTLPAHRTRPQEFLILMRK